jgi:GMP synthase (glutamine-hydrolysing)
MNPLVLIINYGTLSTSNICSILSSLHFNYFVISPYEIPSQPFTHIILSGSPHSVYMLNSPKLPRWIISSNCPVLGICYGMQLIAYTFGGKVGRMMETEKGIVRLTSGKKVWMNRNDIVLTIPSYFTIKEKTEKGHVAEFIGGKWWAVQYHPESPNAPDRELFLNFINAKK